MCNKKDVVKKVYEDLLKDKKTFEMLKMELSQNGQLDETFICEHILPLAKKVDPSITWQDILAFEKEALTQPKKISLTDLENISGGKASNVLLSCGLLALMGFSGLAASNVASADFIPFSETKEVQEYKAFKENPSPTEEDKKKFEFVDLGEVPFYLQADHMVDGLLWFKSPDEDKAFFVMDRKFEDKKAVYTYSADSPSQLNTAEKTIKKPSLEDIQSQEFKLFNINELTGYLQDSFINADKTKFNPITHKDSQTLQLADDNPLYNFARFFNKDFTFDDNKRGEIKRFVTMNIGTKSCDKAESFSKNEVVTAGTPQTENSQKEAAKKAISSREIFNTLDWDKKLEKNNDHLDFAKKLKEELKKKISWKIAHRTTVKNPGFFTIESAETLRKNKPQEESNTYNIDFQNIRNTGFTFFTLQPKEAEKNIPDFFWEADRLSEALVDFKNIPLASCSTELMGASSNNEISCFNGTSEEIKDQLLVFYINELYSELNDKSDFNESKIDEHLNTIIDTMKSDNLEVRIPTYVAVNKWTDITNYIKKESKEKSTLPLGSFQTPSSGNFNPSQFNKDLHPFAFNQSSVDDFDFSQFKSKPINFNVPFIFGTDPKPQAKPVLETPFQGFPSAAPSTSSKDAQKSNSETYFNPTDTFLPPTNSVSPQQDNLN